jgi:hypothetical protein
VYHVAYRHILLEILLPPPVVSRGKNIVWRTEEVQLKIVNKCYKYQYEILPGTIFLSPKSMNFSSPKRIFFLRPNVLLFRPNVKRRIKQHQSCLYITIKLFNLCQHLFLPFYTYFSKCWHRLNEPIFMRCFWINSLRRKYLSERRKFHVLLFYFPSNFNVVFFSSS